MLSQSKIFLVIPVLALVISCSKVSNNVPPPDPICEQPEPDTCIYWSPAIGLVSISGPSVVNAGQPVQLDVVVIGNNGCARSAEITSIAAGNNISLTGNVSYDACHFCHQALVDLNTTYNFTPTQTGIYTFHAETLEGTPIIYTLTVQ